jgi:hypothetical protein
MWIRSYKSENKEEIPQQRNYILIKQWPADRWRRGILGIPILLGIAIRRAGAKHLYSSSPFFVVIY